MWFRRRAKRDPLVEELGALSDAKMEFAERVRPDPFEFIVLGRRVGVVPFHLLGMASLVVWIIAIVNGLWWLLAITHIIGALSVSIVSYCTRSCTFYWVALLQALLFWPLISLAGVLGLIV